MEELAAGVSDVEAEGTLLAPNENTGLEFAVPVVVVVPVADDGVLIGNEELVETFGTPNEETELFRPNAEADDLKAFIAKVGAVKSFFARDEAKSKPVLLGVVTGETPKRLEVAVDFSLEASEFDCPKEKVF